MFLADQSTAVENLRGQPWPALLTWTRHVDPSHHLAQIGTGRHDAAVLVRFRLRGIQAKHPTKLGQVPTPPSRRGGAPSASQFVRDLLGPQPLAILATPPTRPVFP